MDNKYQSEIDDFRRNFCNYKDKRIVLYGVGRYTATLLDGIKDYEFVGLMDKDPGNVGKELFGLPVLDPVAVEQNADMIIINTSETYWNVIYERIRKIRIPVYYKNGERAKERNTTFQDNPFQELSIDGLRRQIDKADIVSFDFFDSLFVRKVCNPRDVFILLQNQIKDQWDGKTDYISARSLARQKVCNDYTLEELYDQIEREFSISHALSQEIKDKEIEIEKRILFPREAVVNALKYAIVKGKEVYIVSDMYLQKDFYSQVLENVKIKVSPDNILVSSEVKKSKATGEIWELLKEKAGKEINILHIGDNYEADVERPQQYGVNTYYVPMKWDMLQNSSLQALSSIIISNYSSIIMGCVMSKLFNDPYILAKDNRPRIDNNYDMGYCVFGPVILTFLLWLEKERNDDGVSRLIFMSRDGYFLSRAYNYLCECQGKKSEYKYITISRQLAMTAAIESEEDFEEYLHMPYSASYKELLEDRFGLIDVKPGKDDSLESLIEANRVQIDKWINTSKDSYRKYISRQGLKDNDAIVDLGFYGNNQRYLSRITGVKLQGYYVNANLSDQNMNVKVQKMKACFQRREDTKADNSEVLKRMIFLESFLSAPQGMVRGMDENGEFVYANQGGNQKYFHDKEEMFEGVKNFIKDYVDLTGGNEYDPDTSYTDKYYGLCFDGSMEYSDDVKKSFYNDNAMMNRIESQLFY